MNIFQLISAVADYNEKFLFMYISKDGSEIYCAKCNLSLSF